MINSRFLLVPLVLLCSGGCQSFDSLEKGYEPEQRASWEVPPQLDKPFYAYKTEGSRSTVRINRDNGAVSSVYGSSVPVVAIGNTRVTKADGTSQPVTIYKGIPRR